MIKGILREQYALNTINIILCGMEIWKIIKLM